MQFWGWAVYQLIASGAAGVLYAAALMVAATAFLGRIMTREATIGAVLALSLLGALGIANALIIQLERIGHQPSGWLAGPILLAVVLLLSAAPGTLWLALYFIGKRPV